ncbi:heat shock protein, mitochondrial [Wickerhamiella sorbophila]|uniref:Heat shock protein, mitochondrial n=1 Tax=Wickerhamiella sorbophila TaxID=45607 RepID=A0A2T0FF19_9ASCO|nr:heat shock protein, mitochondrial [Wickerhamiella sorbophila]PRT53596.1 heat shock protein, mitochondrial [Wickerhamiella sorbophila]
MSTSVKSVKNIVPLLDRVLVQRIKAQAQTASGIFIPEKNVEKLSEASVIATGPGITDKDGKSVPTSVKSGDKVLIPPYGGSSVKVGEETYLLFRDNEILAKINE